MPKSVLKINVHASATEETASSVGKYRMVRTAKTAVRFLIVLTASASRMENTMCIGQIRMTYLNEFSIVVQMRLSKPTRMKFL